MQLTFGNAGYDTRKDLNVAATYHAQAAYDDKAASRLASIEAQNLLNGVQAAQRDGYAFVTWTGPHPMTVNFDNEAVRVLAGSRASPPTLVYRGFEHVVTGWKAGDGKMPATAARPIAEVIAELKAKAVEQGKAEAAAPAASTSPAPVSKMQWPLEGTVAVKFGEPIAGRPIVGIVIEAPDGTIVKAADAGAVEAAGPTVVWLVHPGGYATIYNCLSSVAVVKGQSVPAGAVLGKVGKAGKIGDCAGATQSGLLLYMRHGRDFVDPLTVLPPR